MFSLEVGYKGLVNNNPPVGSLTRHESIRIKAFISVRLSALRRVLALLEPTLSQGPQILYVYWYYMM